MYFRHEYVRFENWDDNMNQGEFMLREASDNMETAVPPADASKARSDLEALGIGGGQVSFQGADEQVF